MVGALDAKLRREKDKTIRRKSDWPWTEINFEEDGSERGIEGYVYTPQGADFQIRGTVRWWRSAKAIAASNKAIP
jgi:hypothetical protein